MSVQERAGSKAPIEIWIEIFGHYLGPSLASPVHSSLRDYERYLFVDEATLLSLYKSKERQRSILRRVSRLWKLIADQLDDRITFICLEKEFKLPPHCNMTTAKLIYYVSSISVTYLSSLPAMSFAQRYDLVVKSKPYALVVGEIASMAPIVHIHRHNVIIPDEPTLPDGTLSLSPIRALSWVSPLGEPHWMDILCHHQFHLLVAFEVNLWSDPPWMVRPELCLPYLRCLVVKASSSTFNMFASWRFPALQFLAVVNDYTSTIVHLAAFIQRHSTTITDLKLITRESSSGVKNESDVLASCQNGLPRLNVYTTRSLCTFGLILPELLRMLGTSHGTRKTPERRLKVRFLSTYLTPHDSKASAKALEEFKQVSSRIKLEMDATWDDLTRSLSHDQGALVTQRRFIDTVNRVKAPVSDGEGNPWKSKAARRYVSEIQRLLVGSSR